MIKKFGAQRMDRIDWKILEELEQDARVSFAELGERVGLSKSPCWNRVRNLQHSGTIQSFGARLDPGELGLGVQCYISITIRFDSHSAFEAAVIDHPAIFECHTTAGESDYLLRVYARSVEHLDELLRHEISKLPGVSGSSTTICLKTIKSQASIARWSAENCQIKDSEAR
ncbi:Lrp/AsnC family transcriptional regulator [Aquisediminimonas profunda]|uniref:Lrp/AsnC family transcriptional regulator n=1 Tax=Aquisediminimonas profunda TaxID=1550733 RepID=UPI001FE5ACF6|nr:Lrp/AsnC family transcriptional regulator [Aquisediminimonas profunda]